MYKLKLELEDLSVESFTTGEEGAGGTVHARSESENTCYDTCNVNHVTCAAGCNTLDEVCTYQYATDGDCTGGAPSQDPRCPACVHFTNPW